jgi:hypothetical protein
MTISLGTDLPLERKEERDHANNGRTAECDEDLEAEHTNLQARRVMVSNSRTL